MDPTSDLRLLLVSRHPLIGRIEGEVLTTNPLSRSRADEIAEMRAWADGRAVFAGAAPPRRDPDP